MCGNGSRTILAPIRVSSSILTKNIRPLGSEITKCCVEAAGPRVRSSSGIPGATSTRRTAATSGPVSALAQGSPSCQPALLSKETDTEDGMRSEVEFGRCQLASLSTASGNDRVASNENPPDNTCLSKRSHRQRRNRIPVCATAQTARRQYHDRQRL